MSMNSSDGTGSKRPPTATRIKKGKSGNRRRRTAFPKRAQDIIEAVLDRNVRINDEGTSRVASVREAVLTKLAFTAAGGNKRALKLFLEFHSDPANYGGDQGAQTEIILWGQDDEK